MPATKAAESPETPVHRDRNLISTLIGVTGFVAFWGLCLVADGGNSNTFIDFLSAAVVIVTPATALLAIYGWAGCIDAVCWIGRRPSDDDSVDEAVTFFQLAAGFAMAAGFLGTLIGLVIMLANLNDPSQVGPGMAVALLTQLYGVFIAVCCIGLGAYVARRHRRVAAARAIALRAASVAGITTIAGTVTVLMIFCLLLLSLSPGL